ncbi:invasion associated locus B family protein [Suttonella ornithocola]|uniref:Invasion protein B, involved in pathogenesis n=1 Tax=Suttonella ornithocola TaxID=279832 RepID=A0A380MZG6_9GAMM|nr:invasion associated locus B family protein [Suttonella ornithocola]SUO97614.1 Invasion protein B, involved in pathogenesis [Suttonella ornithocola]
MKTLKLLTIAAIATTSLAATAAVKQGQKFGDFEGVCQGKECAVAQIFKNAENTPVGRIVLQKMPQAGNNPVAIFTLPLGVNLQAGVGLAIDTKEVARVPFDFCDQGGCNVAVPLQGDLLKKIKAGNKLQVAAFVGDKQQTIEFSLKGITSAINAL